MQRLLGLVLAAGFCLPALAQTTPAPPRAGTLAEVPPGATRVSEAIGTEVIGSNIRRLGTTGRQALAEPLSEP